MSGNFQKKTSNFFVTFFIGLIVISFMFTGYETMRGTPDTVAKVGSISIKAREYQQEYERQIMFYRNIFGGKDLTSEQIENFNIKRNTINNLITKKLWIKLADDVDIKASNKQIIQEIQKQPYFHTNNQFDFQKYKGILAANRLSTTDYESIMAEEMRGQTTHAMLSDFPLSRKYMKEIELFKDQKVSAWVVEINKQAMKQYLPVSKKEVDDFLADATKLQQVEALFKDRKSSLDQPEQVQARHILLRTDDKNEAEVLKKINKIASETTPANFARQANKYTQDPSGKDKGGKLGWFGKGRMVKEFEKVAFEQKPGTVSKPVKSPFGYHLIFVEAKKAAKEATFAEHKTDLAKELIRNTQFIEVVEMSKKLAVDIRTALQKNDIKEVERLQEKYKFKFDKDVIINRYDGSLGNVAISADNIAKIFSVDLSKPTSFVFQNTNSDNVVHIKPFDEKKKSPKEFLEEQKRDRNGLKMALARKLSQELITAVKEDSKIKIYDNVLVQ